MAEPTPIKPGLAPVFDAERELVDFFITKLRHYQDKHGGLLPNTIAVVFTATDAEHALKTGAYSWALDGTATRFQTCALASTLLHKRSLDCLKDV